MNTKLTFAASTAICALMTAPMAQADVTAADVWQNAQDYIATFGGDFAAQVTPSGDTVSVVNPAITYALPFEAGTLTINLPDMAFDALGDGTVAVEYGDALSYAFSADITDMGVYSGTIAITMDGHSTIASGVPGDVTYISGITGMTVRLAEFSGPDTEGLTAEFNVALADMASQTQITVGDLVTAVTTYSAGAQTFDTKFSDPSGGVSSGSGTAAAMTGSAQLMLPRGGMDILDMAKAMADGLQVTGATRLEQYQTEQTVTLDGTVMSRQIASAASYDTQVELAADAFVVSGSAETLTAMMEMADLLPFPVSFSANAAEGALRWPLSASDALQDAGYSVAIDGLQVDEGLLGMFDPAGVLPRTPMVVEMDIAAKVKNLVNWLSFADLITLETRDTAPLELHELTLNTLVVEAAGARLTGAGAATFDNSDLETFGGMPRPSGAIDLSLVGGNALLDSLVSMGLLSDQDAMGARMGMAMMAVPDPDAGPDAIKSRLEINDQGHILANGQRIQ